ncbi:unnamed protein product [Rhodiola kirilowii]
MAETLVSLMAKLSLLAIRDLVGPMFGLSEAIENVIRELKTMNAFLKMVDRYEVSALTLEEFIKQVSDLANEADDVIDKYILLCSETREGNGPFFIAVYLFRQTRNVGTRYSIAGKARKITLKIKNARNTFDNYDKILPTGSTSEIASCSTAYVSKHTQDGLFKEDLIGIKGPKAELIRKLVDEIQTLKVIPVFGMAGMGKTTLVTKVFEDDKVKNHFQRHLWINFSANSKLEELYRELIEKHCQESRQLAPEGLGTMKSRDMKQVINRLLKDERYLIILDDVQALDKWNDCSSVFPNNNKGSRVIITTQDDDVAASAKYSRGHKYCLEPLSNKDSQTLFCLKAFDGEACPDQLSKVQNSILEKCGGMPLGIGAIGSLLHDKNKTVAEWSQINDSLGIEMKGNPRLGSITEILTRCYHDISDDLKPCLLYMSIFPKDHLIGHLKLIRLWVAEGFVAQDGSKLTADDVAENYLSKLRSRSLIQVAERRSDGRVKSYSIHGLMREILSTKSKDQNFVARNKTIDSYSKVRRLSVEKSFVDLKGTLCSLRSLLLFEVEKRLHKSTMPMLFDGKSKLLTVLDLQGANVVEFPSAITDLLNLRYLSLRDTMVKDIPNSIGRLKKLETLDLKRTLIQKLPNQMKHLQQLQNLLLYQYGDDKNGAFPSKHGFQAPEGIGALTSLKKLCFIEADKDSCRIVEELGKLIKLRRLGIVKLSTIHEGELWSSIQNMSELRALSVTASNGETMNLEGLHSPPECLERLYLTGALKSFPQWTELPSLQNLVKIFLKSSKLDEEPIEKLGNLKNLQHIELQQVYNGQRLCFKRDKFQKLKILGLRKLEYLETVAIEENSMPTLEKFLIQECRYLKTLPQGINRLCKLRVLDFVDMPEEVYTMIRPSTVPGDGYGDNYEMIRHIPQVSFTTNEDDFWNIRRVCTLTKDPSSSEIEADKLLVKEIVEFREK